MTILVLACALGTGVGLWLILLGARPRPRRLDRALAVLDTPPPPSWVEPAGEVGWSGRAGRPMVRVLRQAGLPPARTRRDLATLDKPAGVHLAEQATAATAGLLLAPALTALLTLGGLHLPVGIPAGAALALAALGFLAPEWAVLRQAAAYRAEFRHALGTFLNLVVTSLAGGSGVDQALTDSAAVGQGPAFTHLRYALAEAHDAGVAPSTTLAALGASVGVEELSQLAATVGLAGTEGTKVRASLRARAAALATRQLTDAEAQATAATERLRGRLVSF